MLLHIQSMVPGPTCCRNHSGTTCTIYRQPQPLLRERSSPRRSCSPLQTTTSTMHVRHNSPLPSPDKTILRTKYSKENSHTRITVPEPYPLPQACPPARSKWFDPCSEEFRWERSSPQSSQYRCGMISSHSAGQWRTQCCSSRLLQRNNWWSLFPCRRWHSKYQLMIVAWG